MVKKILLGLALLCIMSFDISLTFAAPSFNQDVANPLTVGIIANENMISPMTLGINPNMPLRWNIYNLFSPSNNNAILWRMLRTVMVGVLILYLAWTGIEMMQKAGDEKGLQKARKSFLYILFGCFLVWGVTWILGTALQIDTVQGSQGLLSNLQNNALFQVLAFLKGLAFFYAIIMFIYYGFQFMRALEEESKIKAARTGIVNVIVALILIKIIDFIYYLAQQQNFASQFQSFLVNAARISAYVLGSIMVIMLIYGGVKYLTAQGDEAKVKDAQKIITTSFFVILIIFLFLLIAYQVIAEFT